MAVRKVWHGHSAVRRGSLLAFDTWVGPFSKVMVSLKPDFSWPLELSVSVIWSSSFEILRNCFCGQWSITGS